MDTYGCDIRDDEELRRDDRYRCLSDDRTIQVLSGVGIVEAAHQAAGSRISIGVFAIVAGAALAIGNHRSEWVRTARRQPFEAVFGARAASLWSAIWFVFVDIAAVGFVVIGLLGVSGIVG